MANPAAIKNWLLPEPYEKVNPTREENTTMTAEVIVADFGCSRAAHKLRENGDPNTDEALVARFQAGEERAFELLWKRHESRVSRAVSRYLKDPDLLQDVVQESFVKAYKGMKNFRCDSMFYTWLYRIALNTCFNVIKTNRRWQYAVDFDEVGEDTERFADLHQDGPESDLMNEDLKQAVDRAISRLPLDLRSALTLREFEGMSYEEIAEVLDCRVGTVKSRISRAREFVMQKTQNLYVNVQS